MNNKNIFLGVLYLRYSGLSAQTTKKQPNIVFIMSDDHSYQTISAYHHPLSKIAPTPNIDRIAKNGMIFDRAYVENSICSPCRATCLTGMYSQHHGQKYLGYAPSKLDTTKTFYVELLQKAGYETAIFGKWHLRAEPKGFNYYDILFDQGEYYNPEFRTPATNGKYVREVGYATTLITKHALSWLDNRNDKNKPFCLLIHHKAPHRNWMPDSKNLNEYENITFPEPANLFEDYSTKGSQMQTQELTIAKDLGYGFDLKVEELKDEPIAPYIKKSWNLAMDRLTPEQRAIWDKSYAEKNKSFLRNKPTGKNLIKWKYQRYVKDYCRTIKSIDEEVGNVLDYLKKNGLDKNTIVIYTSDQGFFMGEHGLYDKRMMYEETFRTPFIISYPSVIKSGQKCSKLIQNIDFAPTLLSMAGIKPPKDMDGSSIVPLLRNPDTKNWRNELFYHYYDYPSVGMVRKHYGIQTEKYKLIHWYGKGKDKGILDNWELYDLTKDRSDKTNLYGKKEYISIQEKLMLQLVNMQKCIGDLGVKE